MLLLLSRVTVRRQRAGAELDTAIAGVQLGLEAKRPRWLAYLQTRLAELRAQAQAQTVPAAGTPRSVAGDGGEGA